MRADQLDKAVLGFLALMQERHDILGAMLTGSYVTGTMMPHSDIDVFFIWQDEGRSMRGCTVFEGVAFEYFFSPVWKYRDRLKTDLWSSRFTQKAGLCWTQAVCSRPSRRRPCAGWRHTPRC